MTLNRKIKILHVTSTRYGIGGVEKLLLDMSDKYDFSRFDISYCNLFCDKNGEGIFPTTLRQNGLQYFGLKENRSGQIPQMIRSLSRLIKDEKFDIVHTHMLMGTIVGQLAARWAGRVRKILTRHYTSALVNHNFLVQKTDLWLTAKSDGVISISDAVKKDMIASGIPEATREHFPGTRPG